MDPDAFRTPADVPVPAVTADEMRGVDRVAVEEFGLALLSMMENAGRTLAAHARELRAGPVTVLAGSGGNGGGGLACARHLANRDVPVSVVLDRPPADLEGAAARQHGVLAEMEVPVGIGPDALDDSELVVDALVGYGLQGPLRGPAADLVTAANRVDSGTLSLDVPSGRDATSGAEPGVAVDPDYVLTLALPKTGLVGLDAALSLADISIPAAVYDRLDLGHERLFDDAYAVGLREC
jgi:NAD(P)H-hydrate epimerase